MVKYLGFIFLLAASFNLNGEVSSLTDRQLQADSIYTNLMDYFGASVSMEESKEKWKLLNRIRKGARSRKDQMKILFYEGSIYTMEERVDSAMHCFKILLSQEHKSVDKKILSDVHLHLGRIYASRDHVDLALRAFRKSIEYGEKDNDWTRIARGQVELASVFTGENKQDSSKVLFENALELYYDFGILVNCGIVHAHLYDVNMELGKYDEAFKHLNATDSIGMLLDDEMLRFTYLVIASDYYLQINDLERALEIAVDKEKAAQQFGSLNIELESVEEQVEIFEKLNRMEEAFVSAKKMDSLRAALLDQDYFESMKEVENQLKVQKKNHEIELLKKEQLNEKETARKIVLIGVIIILLLLFTVVVLLLWGYKKRLNQERLKSKHLIQMQRSKEDLLAAKAELYGLKNTVSTNNEIIRSFERILKRSENEKHESTINRIRESLILTEADIESFFSLFDRVYPAFIEYLESKYKPITRNDKIILALVFLEIKSSDQSAMLGISVDSLRTSRYRLKKKLKLESDGNLRSFMNDIYKEFRGVMEVGDVF